MRVVVDVTTGAVAGVTRVLTALLVGAGVLLALVLLGQGVAASEHLDEQLAGITVRTRALDPRSPEGLEQLLVGSGGAPVLLESTPARPRAPDPGGSGPPRPVSPPLGLVRRDDLKPWHAEVSGRADAGAGDDPAEPAGDGDRRGAASGVAPPRQAPPVPVVARAAARNPPAARAGRDTRGAGGDGPGILLDAPSARSRSRPAASAIPTGIGRWLDRHLPRPPDPDRGGAAGRAGEPVPAAVPARAGAEPAGSTAVQPAVPPDDASVAAGPGPVPRLVAGDHGAVPAADPGPAATASVTTTGAADPGPAATTSAAVTSDAVVSDRLGDQLARV
ncbi:MAG TPA: hypothetical protein VKG45_04635 [Actinomycetes bacterium]|nr:hypothetical protein [Actinomycetes bacterium]